ncbi:MAG: YbaN family protein [Bacteroidales bacterium]
MNPWKFILVLLGTISLGIGVVGIVVPGLPTTPFLLLTAGLYMRSSDRLYNWLLSTRVCGARIKRWQEKKGMTRREKVLTILMMWSMISVSVVFLLSSSEGRLIVISLGIVGTVVMGFVIRTIRN